jgi:hypothetical protein
VIPIRTSGTIDTDQSSLTANELMQWGLMNLWRQGEEGAYAIRHSAQPVSDWGIHHQRNRPHNDSNASDNSNFGTQEADGDCDIPNFWARAFPALFPYGLGGLEEPRPVPVDFKSHIRWTLRYHDRRFRCHETYPFVAFGITQRRDSLASARVQMRRKDFERDMRLLASISKERWEVAIAQEQRRQPITDPAICALRSHIHASSARVQGSNSHRFRLRSKIWSTAVWLGPPSLWITINPTDLHDPIVQVFAGEQIDLDKFVTTAGPSPEKRAENVARDPYAAAKFHHFIVQVILETLFGAKRTRYKFTSNKGIFGYLNAYFGMDETQGRGTLHLHMLLFLRNAPTSAEMHALLQTEEFCNRLVKFIQQSFRAYLPGLESKASIAKIPKEPEIVYSRPINPDMQDYDVEVSKFELRLARTEQVHDCSFRRCLVPAKDGFVRCKRRAPFEKAAEDYVKSTGKWCQRREYEFMNGWVPGITVNVRCNNDGKFLTNGEDTKNISMYSIKYGTKAQGKHYNMSAVLAKGYAYNAAYPNPAYVDKLREQQRLMVFRLVHTINREQELAGPIVQSYLMNWGDTHCSHNYSTIFWTSFASFLLRMHPGLRQSAMKARQNLQSRYSTGHNRDGGGPEDDEGVPENDVPVETEGSAEIESEVRKDIPCKGVYPHMSHPRRMKLSHLKRLQMVKFICGHR